MSKRFWTAKPRRSDKAAHPQTFPITLGATYISPAIYGERLQACPSNQEFRDKVFIQKYTIKRGDTLLCVGTENCALRIRHPDDPDRIKTIAAPLHIKLLCA